MDIDVLNKLEAMANHNNRIVETPDGSHYFVIDSEGEMEQYIVEPKDLTIEFFDTQSLLAKCASMNNTGYSGVTLYYSENAVHAVGQQDYRESWRHYQHTLMLPFHPAFRSVDALQATCTYTQKQLVRLLKTRLAGYVLESDVEVFKHLRLSGSEEGEVKVGQGSDGLSMSVRREVADGKGERIPEQIIVRIPVYGIHEMLEFTYPVTILVDLSTDDNGRPEFALTAVHNDIEKAKVAALGEIKKKLGEAFPVYFGKP